MSAQPVMEHNTAPDRTALDSKVPEKGVIPVAGGKGGTGKSTLTANIGVGLALLGYRVILVDGHLGGADLHLFFDQVAPSRSLSSFLTREASSLKDVMLSTSHQNLKLICGGNELIGTANLPFLVKEKLMRHVRGLEADFVVLDLGAGTAFNTLDLFSMSNHGLVVCTPQPHARVDAYGFIKNVVYRKLRRAFSRNKAVLDRIDHFARTSGRRSGRIRELIDELAAVDVGAAEQAAADLRCLRPRLVLNQVRNRRQLEDAGRFIRLVEEYLSVSMEYAGYVRADINIVQACERRRPLLLDNPGSPAAQDISSLVLNGLGVADRLQRFGPVNDGKMADIARAHTRASGTYECAREGARK